MQKKNSFYSKIRKIGGGVFTLPLVIILLLSFPMQVMASEAVPSEYTVNWPKAPETNGRSVILMEESTGVVLYAKNIHEKCYPAALTAVMTSMLAAENCDLDERVEFSTAAVRDVPSGVVNIAIDPGESLTVSECLQAILIRGAAECGFALAEHVGGGSRDSFVAMMNSRAAALGCKETSFANPVGLHSEDHYTTAYDMALIGRDFFDNELLCKYSLQKNLHLYPTEFQKDEIIEHNGNRMAIGGTYEYPYLIGARTGYTEEAGYCLIAGAEKDGMKLIVVILDDGSDERYEDAINLFNYGFSDFALVNASENEKSYNVGSGVGSYGTTDIMGDSRPMLSLDKKDYVVLPLTVEFTDLQSRITYENVPESEAARIIYSYQGVYLGKCSILFGEPSDVYDFGTAAPEEVPAEEKQGKTFVFINIAKVAKISAVIAAGLGLIYLIGKQYKKYRKVHPNWRRQYRKERKKSFFAGRSFRKPK